MDTQSLAHSKWNCKYHVVFAPKYRRQVIYSQIRKDIGTILRKLCDQKGIEIIEAELCPDHVHMLIYKVTELYNSEVSENLTTENFSIVQLEGNRSVKRNLIFYYLD